MVSARIVAALAPVAAALLGIAYATGTSSPATYLSTVSVLLTGLSLYLMFGPTEAEKKGLSTH
ncbi:MAG: hypothetical protein SV253_09195 [Halobacteria archaeon]|nr:hypothetical protein [Halobacteria archaeon]